MDYVSTISSVYLNIHSIDPGSAEYIPFGYFEQGLNTGILSGIVYGKF